MRAVLCRDWGAVEQSAEAIRLLTDRKAHGKVVVVVEPG